MSETTANTETVAPAGLAAAVGDLVLDGSTGERAVVTDITHGSVYLRKPGPVGTHSWPALDPALLVVVQTRADRLAQPDGGLWCDS
ncbi:hypothetical protein ACFWB2_31955 [Streptomyces virginiae]|uniref:hypothetical protein n=1 Tax=Streptomyces virginiae TaxID=1961 RepID=UPI0036815EED